MTEKLDVNTAYIAKKDKNEMTVINSYNKNETDDYIIRHARRENPSICFLPTASGDSADYMNRFYQSFKAKNCEPTHLSLFKPPTRNLREFVLQQDIIYVGGGNTVNLILLWKHNEYRFAPITSDTYLFS